MKISILGANGFLSTSIAKYAIGKGWLLDMYGLDKPIQHTYSRFYPIDLLRGDIDTEVLCKSDIIVYAVGAGIQSNLNEDANLIYALNVNAPTRICNALKQSEYKGVFISFGSYFELGECDLGHPATEEEVQTSVSSAPTDYVVSKRMLTRFVTSYKHDFTHWHFILPTIYGRGENPQRLIPYTVNAIRSGTSLHFTAGNQVRQYIHVSEVPQLISVAIEKDLPSGVYNVAGNETLTVRELVQTIHEVLNVSLHDDCFGAETRSDVNMKFLSLDGGKLFDAIGFKAEKSIRELIKEY